MSAPPPPADVAERLRHAIEQALPGARVQVASTSPGHFEILVIAAAFAERSRLEQHRAVYAAIAPLMEGANAPVHAVDRLETRTS